jgi:hypothetical protein
MYGHQCHAKGGEAVAQVLAPDDISNRSVGGTACPVGEPQRELDDDAIEQEQTEWRAGIGDEAHPGIEQGEAGPDPEADPQGAADGPPPGLDVQFRNAGDRLGCQRAHQDS